MASICDSLPLDERKRELARLKLPTDRGFLRTSEAIIGHGPQVFQAAGRAGLEGIVSKRRQSVYRSGRGTDWIKVKCQNHSEFVIGGFTEPGGSRKGFGALLLGYFDQQKRLIYAGRVGTGFSDRLIGQLDPPARGTRAADVAIRRASGRRWRTRRALGAARAGGADSLQQLDARRLAAAAGFFRPARRQAGPGRSSRKTTGHWPSGIGCAARERR